MGYIFKALMTLWQRLSQMIMVDLILDQTLSGARYKIIYIHTHVTNGRIVMTQFE